MTGKQTTCFSFCARLLFTLPHANLETLLDLLEDRTNKKPRNPLFEQVTPTLTGIARRFFENDFYSANYASTREEIKARVYGVLQNDTLATIFNANTRKLDIADCIKNRKLVLINTRLPQLSEDHQILGRYIITLTKDAILSRSERHPVYVVIDEFQEFADSQKTPELLRLIREYNGGAVLAHQNMYCDELDDAIRSAISTNTSIKYASSPEGQDLGYMARDMRCEPEFLKQQHRSDTHAKFACFVRGMHPPLQHPFIFETELGWVDTFVPKMTDDEYRRFRAKNKAALADETRRPPQSEGLGDQKRIPAEADTPIVSTPKPPATEASQPTISNSIAKVGTPTPERKKDPSAPTSRRAE